MFDEGYEFWNKAKSYLNFCSYVLDAVDHKYIQSVAFNLIPICLLLDQLISFARTQVLLVGLLTSKLWM